MKKLVIVLLFLSFTLFSKAQDHTIGLDVFDFYSFVDNNDGQFHLRATYEFTNDDRVLAISPNIFLKDYNTYWGDEYRVKEFYLETMLKYGLIEFDIQWDSQLGLFGTHTAYHREEFNIPASQVTFRQWGNLIGEGFYGSFRYTAIEPFYFEMEAGLGINFYLDNDELLGFDARLFSVTRLRTALQPSFFNINVIYEFPVKE